MTMTIDTSINRQTLARLLSSGREKARSTRRPVLVSMAQPVQDAVSAQSLFSRKPKVGTPRLFWGRPGQDFWLVGHDKACLLTASGRSNVDITVNAHRKLMQAAIIEGPSVRGVGPLFMGGFRYDTLAARDSLWEDFGDAWLVLPRFLFTWSAGARWLTVNFMVKPDADAASLAEGACTDLAKLYAATEELQTQPQIEAEADIDCSAWTSTVEKALSLIQDGQLSKVVLARKKELRSAGPYSLKNAIQSLCKAYPSCTVFSFENGKSAFVGASPETLAQVVGRKLSLTCLASSAARGVSSEEDTSLAEGLAASSKEQREHQAVVSMLADSLKDACNNLSWEKKPRVLKLANVQHLLTPFSCDLVDGYGLLDIVKRLHPTPAVGGVPTNGALEFIRNAEGDRGWYAAPVGWIDHNSSGEFVVGIRSALVRGDHAMLYAGAGIIEGSDPEQEFRETEMKFKPMLAALKGE